MSHEHLKPEDNQPNRLINAKLEDLSQAEIILLIKYILGGTRFEIIWIDKSDAEKTNSYVLLKLLEIVKYFKGKNLHMHLLFLETGIGEKYGI